MKFVNGISLSAICLVLILVPAVLAGAGAANTFTEDFSTKQHCDTLNTTALWDTVAGELRLPPFGLALAGSYDTPGNAYEIATAGDYAFVADNMNGLRVIDISDPTNPVEVGNYDTSGYAYGVAITGDHAFVCDAYSGFKVIDISDPTNPILAGSYSSIGWARNVDIEGDYAYVAEGEGGLCVIDISDPTNPSEVGRYDTADNSNDVEVEGDYAYVTDGYEGLYVFDVSDPTAPDSIANYNTVGSAMGLVIDGNYAFIASYSQGFHVIDISDPAAPSLAGSFSTLDYAYSVEITGDYAYIAQWGSGIRVLDIVDPTNPTLIEDFDTPGNAMGVVAAGEYLFVADRMSGLQIVKIADNINPIYAGSISDGVGADAVEVEGNYAFVADGWDGLKIVDISDPSNPLLTGTYDTPGYAEHAVVAGDYAYIADYDSGLQVVDISDPSAPVLVGNYLTSHDADDIEVGGNYAYLVIGYLKRLEVIDITDPTSPVFYGNCDMGPNYISGIDLDGDYAYVGNQYDGLKVIDISDPANPVVVGSYDTYYADDVEVSGNYAYVADRSAGLQVIDISDPTNPVYAGSYDPEWSALGIEICGDYLFIPSYFANGLRVMDISDPTTPTEIGDFDTPGMCIWVDVAGDNAYVADGAEGLQVIQVFQRLYDLEKNTGQSTIFEQPNKDAVSFRLSTSQSDSISWQLSADDGSHWDDVVPDGSWHNISNPGNELHWKSTHEYTTYHVNPTVSSLEVEWLYECALIDSIVDVPNDQGGQVRIAWTRSGYDFIGSPQPPTEYAIYRKIDYGLPATASGRQWMSPAGKMEGIQLLAPPGDWDSLTAVPAYAEDVYFAVVPTLKDSTVEEGMYFTSFYIRAWTDTPGVYFDSEPDSGYSLDNLVPHIPTGILVAYNSGGRNELTWDESPDADFKHFKIYRGTTPDFTPSPEALVHVTSDTEWSDDVSEGWQYHYKITAVDFSGNESDPGSPETVSTVDKPEIPETFFLYQNIPNPFNPSTVVCYGVPEGGGKVTIRIYDVGGRLVRTLIDGIETAGRKIVIWDGRDDLARRVASGVYFCHMRAPGFERARKMVLLQ